MTKEAPKGKVKSETMELLTSFVAAVLLAVIFRSFAYEPFHIPSGSMKPTLLIGDYIFVSKFSYGYSKHSLPFGFDIFDDRVFKSKPERGDVAVFKLPEDTSINYIKRIIGLPGDTIQVLNGVLYINGKTVEQKKVKSFKDRKSNGNFVLINHYVETLPNGVSYSILDEQSNGSLDNTPPYLVPEGHYFMMGDNRDNSQDSRVLQSVGYVPEVNLVGKATIIFFSSESPFWKIWEWLRNFRTERLFESVH